MSPCELYTDTPLKIMNLHPLKSLKLFKLLSHGVQGRMIIFDSVSASFPIGIFVEEFIL